MQKSSKGRWVTFFDCGLRQHFAGCPHRLARTQTKCVLQWTCHGQVRSSVAMAAPRERFHIDHDSRPIEIIARENSRELPEEKTVLPTAPLQFFRAGALETSITAKPSCGRIAGNAAALTERQIQRFIRSQMPAACRLPRRKILYRYAVAKSERPRGEPRPLDGGGGAGSPPQPCLCALAPLP